MRIPFFSKKEPQAVEEKSQGCSEVYYGGQQEIFLQQSDFLYHAIGQGEGLTGFENLSHEQAMSIYRQSNSVATAVDIISQEISRIKPVLMGPDGTLMDDHEVLEKLSNPNDWNETQTFFLDSMAKAHLLTGNDYVYASGLITRPPLELYVLKPQNVNTITGSVNYRPNTYTVYSGDGRGSYSKKRDKTGFRFYDGNLKELWHNMGYSSTQANYYGDSPLKAICLDVYSQIKGRLHNVRLLDNGGRPSMLITFKDTMGPDQHNERRQLINEQLAGADNAGKIAVISSTDMEMKELGVSNKDMDYENLEKIAEQSVYKRYRVPLPLVSTDASTLDNLKVSVYQLYDFAVLPKTDMLFDSLSMFLLPRYGLDPSQYKITYSHDDISALRMRRIEELAKRKDLNIESINELREDLPRREDVNGGDQILVSSTMIPISDAGMEEADTGETPEQEAQRLADEQST